MEIEFYTQNLNLHPLPRLQQCDEQLHIEHDVFYPLFISIRPFYEILKSISSINPIRIRKKKKKNVSP